jgi:hypothetical protein
LDKENISLRPASRPNHRKPKDQTFEKAIDEVEKGTCSFREKVGHGTY